MRPKTEKKRDVKEQKTNRRDTDTGTKDQTAEKKRREEEKKGGRREGKNQKQH